MFDLLAAAIITLSSPAPMAPADVDVYANEVGDDNENGIIEEDESGWDCTTMGNRVCGEGNSQGVPAGDYGEIDNER